MYDEAVSNMTCVLCVYQDDDLRELRASIERLLHEERNEEEERGDEDGNGSPPEEEGGDCFNGNPALDDDDGDDDDSAEVEEELNGMAEDEEESSNWIPGDEEAGHILTNGLEERSTTAVRASSMKNGRRGAPQQ